MHIFLDNFHQGGKYSDQIASHQVELTREKKITDQNSLSVSSLNTGYLNLDRISGCGKNSERANSVQKKCTFGGCAKYSAGKCFKMIRKGKETARTAGDSDKNRRTERTPCKKKMWV